MAGFARLEVILTVFSLAGYVCIRIEKLVRATQRLIRVEKIAVLSSPGVNILYVRRGGDANPQIGKLLN
jgi:hypothetical protein